MTWLVACLLMALGCFGPIQQTRLPSLTSTAMAATSDHDLVVNEVPTHTQRIQDVRIGQRVLGENPELSRLEATRLEIGDPAEWREYVLSLTKPTGGDVEIHLLEQSTWLQAESFDGQSIWLDLEEMDLHGRAQLLRIQPCPDIEPDDGTGRSLVTGTFRHSSMTVLDLEIAGEPKPIGVTATHPFWSADRQQFVPAGDLRLGELLRTAAGTLTTVTRKLYRTGLHDVYNLQVDGEHVYYVGDGGLLVHNACSKKLGDNLVGHGKGRGTVDGLRPDRTAAHHIVAGSDSRANPARDILDKVGIGIDDWKNGVFLPRGSKAKSAGGFASAPHSRIHTEKYFEYVNRKVTAAYNTAIRNKTDAKEAVKRALDSISGKLMTNSPIY